MTRSRSKDINVSTEEFVKSAELAKTHGLTLTKLVSGERTWYRLECFEWTKDLYIAQHRIHCPDKDRQGPFVRMSPRASWKLLNVVTKCCEAKELDVSIAELNQIKVKKMLKEIEEVEGTTPQQSLRDLLTDIRHVSSDLDLDIEDALDGSLEVFNEELEEDE